MLCTAFREKSAKHLLLLSTRNIATQQEVRRRGKTLNVPETVNSYNKNMGGCDLADQKIYTYEDDRRTYKWYLKIFHNLLYRSLLNAYILYYKTLEQQKIQNQNAPEFDEKSYAPMTRQKFLKSVIHDLIGKFSERAENIRSPQSGIASRSSCSLEKLPKITTQAGKVRQQEKDCNVCSKGKFKNRKRPTFICATCSVGVCSLCFEQHKAKTIQNAMTN